MRIIAMKLAAVILTAAGMQFGFATLGTQFAIDTAEAQVNCPRGYYYDRTVKKCVRIPRGSYRGIPTGGW